MKIMSKVLGVVLTLAILCGLLLTAVPVAAGDVAWSNVAVPNAMNTNNQIVVGSSIACFDVAPDGKTMFAWVTGPNKLHKSVDGGLTWTTSGIGTGLGAITQIKVSPNFASDSNLVATNGTLLYRSVNGGTDWFTVTTSFPGADPIISSIDISTYYNGGGPAILVGYGGTGIAADGGVALYVTYQGTWSYWSNTSGVTWAQGSATVTGGSGVIPLGAATTLTSTATGTATVTLPAGAAGVVTQVGAVITGSPITLVAGATTNIPITTAGTFTVALTAGASAWTTGDVYAVAFSPNYPTDTEILAVVSDTVNTTVRAKLGVNNWGADISAATVKIAAGTIAADSTNKASLDFPSNYDYASGTNNKIFLGFSAAVAPMTTLGTGGEVYRLKMVLTPGASSATATGANLGTAIGSIAYNGTAAAGTLVAADANSIVYSTDAVNATSSTWNSPTTSVAGTTPNTMLQYSGTKLYAATQGVGFSAFHVSEDANVFSFISLMSVSAGAATTFKQYRSMGPTTWFANIYDSAAVPNRTNRIMKSTDSGVTWKGIFFYANLAGDSLSTIGLSPTYATDNTIYYYTTGGVADKIWKSTDGGATWTRYSPPAGITTIQGSGLMLLDTNTYFVAPAAGNLYKVGTFTQIDLNGAIVNAFSGPITPTWFVVFSTAGTFYFSGDAGATFTKLGTGGEFVNTGLNTTGFVDVPNKTIYAVQSAMANNSGVGNQGTLMKYVVGTSSAWEVVKTISGTPLAGGAVVPFSPDKISLNNGILYATIRGGRDAIFNAAGAVTTGGLEQIWRSVNWTDPNNLTFEAVPGSLFAGNMGELARGPITVAGSPAGNMLTVNSADAGLTVNGIASKVQVLTDSVSVAPASIAPKANDSLDARVDFSWKPVTYSGAKYTVQIAYDKDFQSLVTTDAGGTAFPVNYLGPTSSTVIPQVSLIAGKTYYWRVQVSPQNPMASAFSAPVMFTTKLTSSGTSNVAGLDSVGRISPASGATGVSITSPITWGAVVGATGYNFKISTDPTFATVIDSKDNYQSTAYVPAKLEAGKTYFWEVQSVAGTATSAWIVSAFTTAAAGAPGGPTATAAPPVVTPTVTVNVPPQPTPTYTFSVPAGGTAAPGTPGYVWVIIVIGAILVIAVIVLIVRTRRV